MLTNTLVLKENQIQIVTDEYGDIPAGNSSGYGLYYFDTRYLSTFEFRVNGQRPIYLSHSTDRNYLSTFQFVNQEMLLPDGKRVPRQTISIRRTRFVTDRAMHERLGFSNCNHFPVDLEVTLTFDADFRDMFAVRGFARQRLAGSTTSKFGPGELSFSYSGRDKVLRHTQITFDESPEPVSASTVCFHLHLEPHTPVSIPYYIRPYTGRRKHLGSVDFDATLDRMARSYQKWHEGSTQISTDNEWFDRGLLRQSRLDVRSLLEIDRTENGETEVFPAAGIPWYAVPFGRDAIITAIQTLMYNPAIAVGTLRVLARYQGTKVDHTTEEEPGKIFHELRRGELANLREVPHLPYYGTVDATPLFVVLFVETMKWVKSEELYRGILPHALRALDWVNSYGDSDGDGYIEYVPRGQGGVRNQGWKDSFDSLQYPDGALARLPAALVEAQGYVFHAKMGLSRLVAEHGDEELAARLRYEAEELRARFTRDFWMPDVQFFAQALDADKRQVPSITSNVGHCLWSGIIEPQHARLVVERLMMPDMFSGWGIRTLSSASPNYNPMSYHNGSVWPHDNSLIALGMRRYGFVDEAVRVITATIEAGLRFPSNRLPELFCGFQRDLRFNSSPMTYIRSCSPQAWSAATPFLFIQTLLDLEPEVGGRGLKLDPAANRLFKHYTIENLLVGGGRADFNVAADSGTATVLVTHQDAPRQKVSIG